MDMGVVNLQKDLQESERVSEKLLLAKKKLAKCDQTREDQRAALTALRKLSRQHSQQESPPPTVPPPSAILVEEAASCQFCGSCDPSTPQYIVAPGSSFFVKLPLHSAHVQIEKDLLGVEATITDLRNQINEMTLVLSKMGSAQSVGPNLRKAVSGRKVK